MDQPLRSDLPKVNVEDLTEDLIQNRTSVSTQNDKTSPKKFKRGSHDFSEGTSKFLNKLRRKKPSFSLEDLSKDKYSGSDHSSKSADSRRPSATTDPVTPSSNKKSLLGDVTDMNDLAALKEGLDIALGGSGKEPEWFPVSNESKRTLSASNDSSSVSDVQSSVLDLSQHEGFAENIPLRELPSHRSDKGSFLTTDRANTSPLRGNANPFSGDQQSSYEGDGKPGGSNDPNQLEAGLLMPTLNPFKVSSPSSPTKFTNMISRLSDRVAGSGAASPNASVNDLNTELDHNDLRKSIDTRESTNYESVHSDIPLESRNPFINHMVPGVTVTDENNNSIVDNTHSEGLGLYFDNGRKVSQDGNAFPPEERKESVPSSTNIPIIDQLKSPNIAFNDNSNKERAVDKDKMHLFGKSLKTFSPDSRFRQSCYKISSHNWTNLALLVLLIFQICILSYRQWNPLVLHGYYYKGYNFGDYILVVINVIYTVEIIAKIVAYGLYDDHIMFYELGLPYPESELAQKYFNKDSLVKFFNAMGLGIIGKLMWSKFDKTSFNRPFANKNSESGDDLESKEAESDFDGNEFPSKLGKKSNENFLDQSGLRVKYTDHGISERVSSDEGEVDPGNIGLSYTPVLKQRKLAVKNTLLKNHDSNFQKLHLHRAYLKNNWHRVDFLSMIFFWISLFLSIEHYDAKHHIMLFRAFSCIRILRLCNLTTGTSTILTACQAALPQLIDVSLFITCFWLFFGIIGVQSFKASFSRHCKWTNPSNPDETFLNSKQYCGSYLNQSGIASPYIDRDGEHSQTKKGYTCPRNSKCVSGKNPYGGTVSFDNILQSLELVFVVMSANTFTDLMYDTMDSENLAACLFFIFGIFILTVWLINVFIAVIVASFNLTRMEKKEEKRLGRKRNKVWNAILPSANISTYKERIEKHKRSNTLYKFYSKTQFVFAILIFLDLFSQCFRYYEMNHERERILLKIEFSVTIVLLGEIVCRFLLHLPNWRLFFASRQNIVDLILATINTIIIIPPVKERLGHGYYWLTVFQIMRFYRVVLAVPVTRNLWFKIMGNFKAIFDLALFFFILTFLASIIVARYFEGVIPEDAFDDVDFPVHTLPNAFIALYVITTTENWTEILYALQEYSKTTSSRSFGAVMLVAWFVISNMIILNTFIAVIAQTLEVSEEEKRKRQLLQFINNMTERLQKFENESGMLVKFKEKVLGKKGWKDELEKAVVNLLLSGSAVNDFLNTETGENDNNQDDDIKNLSVSSWKRWFQVNFWRTNNFFKNPFYKKEKKTIEVNNFDPAHFAKRIITERNTLLNQQIDFLKENPNFNNVFYVLGPRHKLRRYCQKLVRSSHGQRIDGVEPNKVVAESFTILTFFVTIALVITACYLTPLYRKQMVASYGVMNWTFYLEVAFTVYFSVEFIIRVFADGLIFTPNAMLRSSWNIIDFIVLISLWIELIAFLKNDGNLSRIFRGFKALRALRLLTVSENAKNNFHTTMISGFGKIINAALISLCLLFPFSIWGLNIFNGRLGKCTDGVSELKDCYNEYHKKVFDWKILSPNVYDNPYLQFDNFSSSFSSLFQIVSLEGWVDLLINVMKSTGIGTVPESFSQPFNGFFVVLFNFVSIIFILTLFVSVIISNYSKTTGQAYMTEDQIAYYHVKRFLAQVKPSSRKNRNEMSRIRKMCYNMTIQKNKIWNVFLNFLLFMHILALLLECFPSYNGLDVARSIVFMFSSVMFLVNSIMLFIAQGFRIFIKYKWNLFNFVVSFGAFITTLISFFTSNESVFININKLFLVGLLSFVIPRSNRLSELLRFASASLPSLISLSFTWIIVFLVYAIAMNQIFGLTKVGPNTSGNINVRSVTKALILLFKCSFGEGWNYVMDDMALEEPFCSTANSLDESDCGNKQYAYILFMLWNVISMYIFLNMFVSSIIANFSYINHRSTYSHLITREEIRKFKRTWQIFDPEGTGYIKPIDLPVLLHSLEGALSFHLYSGALEVKNLCNLWFKRNDPHNPYNIDVNYGAIERTLNSMDIPKIRARRKAYEMFIEEILMTMELTDSPGVSFTSVLLQLPLYISFEAGKCLNLIDFLERRLLVQKVKRRMHTKRCYETIAAYACRWKYIKNRRLGIKATDIDFGKELRRNSYISNENHELNTPRIFVSSDHEMLANEDSDDENSPLTKTRNFTSGDNAATSGVYVPKSPIHIYKSRNKTPTNSDAAASNNQKPKLTIKIAHSDHSNHTSPLGHRDSLDDRLFNDSITPIITPVDDSNSGADQSLDESMPLLDLATVGSALQNSEWESALQEVRSERNMDQYPEHSKKE